MVRRWKNWPFEQLNIREDVEYEMSPWELLKTDMEAMGIVPNECGRLRAIARCVLFPSIHAMAYYRAGHWLATHGMLPLAYILRFHAMKTTGADINPRALIGPYFRIQHTVGIVIGGDVVIEPHVTIYQGVTLGSGKIPGMPYIGAYAILGAGAKVLGGVEIPHDVCIRANSIISRDYTGPTNKESTM